MTRLSRLSLKSIAPNVDVGLYDRQAVRPGVVHLGLGAFHRAHQAVYFDDILRSGDLRWGITSVAIRAIDVSMALRRQDFLYSVLVRDEGRDNIRIGSAILNTLVLAEEPGAVIQAIAKPETHLVTLTITEKGYHLVSDRRNLDLDSQEIKHDIALPAAPVTVPGVLVAALRERFHRDDSSLTIISCDNLPQNGKKLRTLVIQLAEQNDPILAAWISARISFPSTMVDRIVPATTMEAIAEYERDVGLRDDALVTTEDFCQWVIEDDFSGPHPDFARVGVTLATNVTAWEKTKLRLLNGAHSAMAYHGLLKNCSYVHEFVADAGRRLIVERLWDESRETLDDRPEIEVAGYRQALMRRFQNPFLRHRLDQIARDGSEKMPQRIIAPLSELLSRQQTAGTLMSALAAWLVCVHRGDCVDDPNSKVLSDIMNQPASTYNKVQSLIELSGLFPQEVWRQSDSQRNLAHAIDRLSDGPS